MIKRLKSEFKNAEATIYKQNNDMLSGDCLRETTNTIRYGKL